MKGITWSLSRFIIIAGENFHRRWLTNGCMRWFSSITSEIKLMFSANSHVGQKRYQHPKADPVYRRTGWPHSDRAANWISIISLINTVINTDGELWQFAAARRHKLQKNPFWSVQDPLNLKWLLQNETANLSFILLWNILLLMGKSDVLSFTWPIMQCCLIWPCKKAELLAEVFPIFVNCC